MNILITGDRGKIGGLARGLLEEAGHDVAGFDIARNVKQDLLLPDSLLQAMTGVEVVVHCAAIPHPRHGGPGRYFDVNVHGTKFVLEMAARQKARRVVYTSSTAYYGCGIRDGQILPLYLPIDERHPPASTSPHLYGGELEIYDISKVMAEQLIAFYGSQRNMETVVLRIAPANTKAWQYRTGFDWRTDDSWKRGCLFTNCHPDYAARAIQLVVEAEGPFWGERFNIMDRYTHGSINVHEFIQREYPLVPVAKSLGEHDSLITPRKAMEVLGFEPCEELE